MSRATRLTQLLAATTLAVVVGLAAEAQADIGPRRKSQASVPLPKFEDSRNRSFDPATGRFLQRDPVLGGDPLYNPYCFPGNNPVTGSDPMGTELIVGGKKWTKAGGQLANFVKRNASKSYIDSADSQVVLSWMHDSARRFEFEDEQDLQVAMFIHEKFRGRIREVAKKFQEQLDVGGVRFKQQASGSTTSTGPEIPAGGSWTMTDPKFTIMRGRTVIGYVSSGGSIVTAQGKSPYKAVKEIFERGRFGYPFGFDCQRGSTVIILGAVAEASGEAAFDRYFKNKLVLRGSLRALGDLDQAFDAVDVAEVGPSFKWQAGDVGRWRNPIGVGPWAGEYAVYLGEEQFCSNPFGIGSKWRIQTGIQSWNPANRAQTPANASVLDDLRLQLDMCPYPVDPDRVFARFDTNTKWIRRHAGTHTRKELATMDYLGIDRALLDPEKVYRVDPAWLLRVNRLEEQYKGSGEQ